MERGSRAPVHSGRGTVQGRPGAASTPVPAAGGERKEGAREMTQAITHGLSRQRVILATAGTMLALLLAALDQTIVGTAIPRIVADLNGLDRLAWVTTAYLVTSTTMTPIAGKLGDLFGRKPFLLAGMIGFVAASALCGLSQDMTQLIVFRGIQGVFGGVLFATVFTVIGDLFPPEQRGRLAGLFGAVFGLSSIIGPTTGGFITDHWSWRWVFEVNIPVGIIAVLVVLAGLPYVRSKASWRDIDFWGAFSLAAGIVPLLIALSITRDHAWTSPQVSGLLAIAAAMLALFIFVESRVVVDLIVVGTGIGITFPLYLTAVQTALPRQYMGVASSQIQFWRNLGGTVGSAILGAVLTNRLPDYLAARISALGIPPQVLQNLPKTGSANAILDPSLLARLPGPVIGAIRGALADSLHDIYVFAALVLILALVATVFMREVPLKSGRAAMGFEAPPVEVDEDEREQAVAAR